jgi:hypothetical protein
MNKLNLNTEHKDSETSDSYFVIMISKPEIKSVGTAHINSGAGQSQLRRRPMLSNGRINTFPQ